MSNVYKGDIWTLQKQNGTIYEVLVLATHERYVTILTLNDREPPENPVVVKSKSTMYTDVGRIGYAFYDVLCDFVKAVPESEFSKIMNKVAAALGIDVPKTPTTAPEQAKMPEPCISAPKPTEPPHTNADQFFTVVEQVNYKKLRLEYSAIARECAVYKELLYKVLPQLGGETS